SATSSTARPTYSTTASSPDPEVGAPPGTPPPRGCRTRCPENTAEGGAAMSASGPIGRRPFLGRTFAVGAGALLTACAAVPRPTAAPAATGPPAVGPSPAATTVPVREATGRRYVIEVQHPQAGPNLEPRNRQFAGFEEVHPDIGVRGVWAA